MGERFHCWMMAGLLFLTSMVLGWALGCCLTYVLLRWFNLHFAPAVRSSGAWALVGWVILYVGLGMRTPFSGVPDEIRSYPLNLSLGIVTAFVGVFLVGSLIMRFLPGRNELWWHDVLFCALYLGCAQVWGYMLLVCWPTQSGPLYEIAQWNGETYDSHWLMLCVWFFPLGAPLMDLLGRNLRRLQGEMAP